MDFLQGKNDVRVSIPTVRTQSLSLIPLRPADAEVLHRIYQTDGVLGYFPGTTPPPPEKVQRFIARQQEHWEKFGYGNWGILPDGRAANQIIGWAGLQFLPELNETEVGFLMDGPFWGKGYATEAARASLQFGLDHFDFPHLIALVHPDNPASRRVLEKCGMTYEETIHLWGIDLMRHCIARAAS
jgi:ribosomal-protein-alanine N-acetyltransferase